MALQQVKYPLTHDLTHKARILTLAGDETRIRILCLLFEEREACVSEVAGALNMSLPAISHHLRLLKDNGLVETEREGTTICYRMIESPLTHRLRTLICSPVVHEVQ